LHVCPTCKSQEHRHAWLSKHGKVDIRRLRKLYAGNKSSEYATLIRQDLIEFDKKFVRSRLVGNLIIEVLFAGLFGALGPFVNRDVSAGCSVSIALVTSIAVTVINLVGFRFIFPTSRRRLKILERTSATVLGLGSGIILGWGSGTFGLGPFPWAFGMAAFYCRLVHSERMGLRALT
jgi:hypothetical protein